MLEPDAISLTPDLDAATCLHYVDGALWLDTDIAICDGLCIGLGDTFVEAARDGIAELEARIADLRAALEHEATLDALAVHGGEQ